MLLTYGADDIYSLMSESLQNPSNPRILEPLDPLCIGVTLCAMLYALRYSLIERRVRWNTPRITG